MYLLTLLIATMLQPQLCNPRETLSHLPLCDSFTLLHTGDSLPISILSAKESQCREIANAAQNTLLLIFFADWCPDCQLAFPFVNKKLQPIIADTPHGEIIAIGRENTQAEVDSYKAENGLSFKMLPDKERKIYDCFATKYIPRFYLFFDKKLVFQCEDYDKKELKNIYKLLKYRKKHVVK